MGNSILKRFKKKSQITQSQFLDDINLSQLASQLFSVHDLRNSESYKQFYKLTQINCKLHGSPVEYICLHEKCKNGIGCCKRQQCHAEHIHSQKPVLMKKSKFDEDYNERIFTFKTYRDQIQKKIGKIYQEILNHLQSMIKYLKKDSQEMYSQYKYCVNYQDANQLILQGQFQNIQRLDLKKFLETQPIKICQNKFQIINKKLKKRKAQFNKDLTQIQNETEKFFEQETQRIAQQKQKIDIQNNHIKISETKWQKIYKKLNELNQKPKYVLISCNVIEKLINVGQIIDLALDNNNLDLRKFCELLKDQKNNHLKILKLYTNWHIHEQNQFEYFSKQLSQIYNLRKIIIITRQPIKSLQSFRRLSNKINVFCQDWTQKAINMKFI